MIKYLFKGSVYLFRAALYGLMLALDKDEHSA
jgi:hypothetical protein